MNVVAGGPAEPVDEDAAADYPGLFLSPSWFLFSVLVVALASSSAKMDFTVNAQLCASLLKVGLRVAHEVLF